jgi:acetoin utilization deacetylase AcuC-like enzyme
MTYRIGMAAPLLLGHPSSLAHDPGPHPEAAERIRALERELAERDWLGWRRELSPAADRLALERVHASGYLDAIEALCAAGGGPIDLDTRASAQTWEAAVHGAGGAVRMVDALLDGEAPVAFSAHRPPGHHADAGKAMGFCFLNHIAVAARHAIDGRGLERVLVVDWDVHHGNGTNDLFHDSRDVLFVSIHESPLYPGTGAATDAGSCAAAGFTVNLPVAAGSGDEVWTALVDQVVVPLGRAFAPQLLLVSAGYDAHAADPLASCEVTEDGFAAMASSMRRLGDELGAPVGAVLEGGYDPDALARSVIATLAALATPAPPRSAPAQPLARAAAGRLADRWPELSAALGREL